MERPLPRLVTLLVTVAVIAANAPCLGAADSPGAAAESAGMHEAHPDGPHELAHRMQPGCRPAAEQTAPPPIDVRPLCPCGCDDARAPAGAAALDPAVLADPAPGDVPARRRFAESDPPRHPGAQRALPDPVPLFA